MGVAGWQVYLKEYYELHGVFELIDAGSVRRICSTTHGQQGRAFVLACRSLAYVGLEGCLSAPATASHVKSRVQARPPHRSV